MGALEDKDGKRKLVSSPDLSWDRETSFSDPQDLRLDGGWDGLDELARPAFRSGAYRGRGGGILSRSGARSADMGVAGGFSGIHRLMNRNKALELELQRVKGMIPNSVALSSRCGVDDDQQLEALMGSKGYTQAGRSFESEGFAPGHDCGVNRIPQLEEQGRLKEGTQPVRQNVSMEKSLEKDAVAIAVNPDDDARATALEFQPPVAGVGLEEYISAALSGRKKSSKGMKSVGVKRHLGGLLGPDGCDDPFPHLPRSAAGGLGPEGDSTSSCNSLGAGLNKVPEIRENVGLKSTDGEAIKFTWTDLLRSSKPDNMCVDLHYVEPSIVDGEACAVFSLEEEAENMLQWQNSLLCYVVGKSPTYYQFLKAMQRQWNPPGGLEMFSRENGIFYCKFGNGNDMKKVIKDGPWYMDGKLVVVKKFSVETNCEDEMLSSMPIWVKLPCLPVQWWSIEGVSKVVSPLGHPLYFDLTSASKSRIAYARCCVEVAMEKNLPSSVLCVGGDKKKKRQNITYDWVPKRCSSCKEFGHMVAECGGAQLTLQQEGKGVWNNKKNMGKGQQIYRPKAKSTIIEVEDQMKSNTQKEGGIVGKDRQIKMLGGSKDAIYQTNLLNSRKATIKATSANSFQLLVDMDDDGLGDKRDGGIKGNHKYFCTDDEEEIVDVLSPRLEAQKLNLTEGVKIINEKEEGKERDLASEPGTSTKGVEVEGVDNMSADDDTRDREARGSGEEIALEPPLSLVNKEMMGLSHGNQASNDEIQESDSEKEEEESIQSYGKQPAEFGMPPTLTVANPKYKGEIEVPIEIKKVKKRSTPAPEQPAGSRTTRHSFKVG